MIAARAARAACAAALCVAASGSAAVAQPGGPERPAGPPDAGQPAPPSETPPAPAPDGAPAEPAPAPEPAEPAPPSAPSEPAPAVRAPAPGEPGAEPEPEPLGEIGDQALGGALGLAAGGRTTAGGVRVTGHFLYQLTDEDWFDGIASFTFGSGDPACFRDRGDAVVCDHGLASGGAIEIAAGVRRMFPPQGRFRPFARAAVGLALVRFSGDGLTGLALPLHAGAGLRAAVAPGIGIIALADVTLGLAAFGRGVGGEPQLGLAITAGAEVRLR
ncbi:MAG TPA: hypothetical protein VNO30_24100 [Kofleriaceae bacterium]|nr:hypothetical protein [Kofleriaceae bacterium]